MLVLSVLNKIMQIKDIAIDRITVKRLSLKIDVRNFNPLYKSQGTKYKI